MRDHEVRRNVKLLVGGGTVVSGSGLTQADVLRVDGHIHALHDPGAGTPRQLSEVRSHATARRHGPWPRRGAVRPGTDADLSLVNPRAERTVRNERLHARNPVSTWHGARPRGAVVARVLGGRLTMRDGEPVGERHGRLVTAEDAGTAALEADQSLPRDAA